MMSLVQDLPPDDETVPVSENPAESETGRSVVQSFEREAKGAAQRLFDWAVGQSRKIAGGVLIGSVVGSATAVAAGVHANLVPAASVVGLALVALIAAHEAGQRQQRQLDFETKRQDEKFRHERALNTIEDRRAVIDDSVALLGEATHRLRQLLMDLRSDVDPQDRAKSTEAASNAVRATRRGGTRLTVRFGPNHQLTTDYEAARDHAARTAAQFRNAQLPITPLKDPETQRIARGKAVARGAEALKAAQVATERFATCASEVLGATT